MLKVVTIMTERYSKILKKGKQDKVKLLFRSLAVFDRRASMISPLEKEKTPIDQISESSPDRGRPGRPPMEELLREQKPADMVEEEAVLSNVRTHVAGFAIDDPADDEEDEDDDELALAALDALDAIEIFKHDNIERKIHHAQIPVENFKKLLMLLLAIAPMESQDELALYGEGLAKNRLQSLHREVDCIVAAFNPDLNSDSIRYGAFTRAISTSLPGLFDPLNALFEHFLFSKNIDLSRHRDSTIIVDPSKSAKPDPIITTSSNPSSSLLTTASLSHISTFLLVGPSTSVSPSLFHLKTRFHSLYSTTSSGTSLSSFSRQVLSWQAPTLLLVSGNQSVTSSTPITLGVFLPKPWDKSATSSSSEPPAPVMFQLSPRHAVFPANPYNKNTPVSHLSAKSGIAFGCIIPLASRTNTSSQVPVLGPVSLRIDPDISTAVFQHDADEGTGAFLPDPCLEDAQRSKKSTTSSAVVPKKIEFEIDTLEVWGIDIPDAGREDAATKQKKQLAWEEAEAARRRGVNFGGDKDGARALLEIAGLVGDQAGPGRTGGSV